MRLVKYDEASVSKLSIMYVSYGILLFSRQYVAKTRR